MDVTSLFTFLGYAGYKISAKTIRKLGKSWGMSVPKVGPKGPYLGTMPSHGEQTQLSLFTMTKATEFVQVHRYITPEILILNI